jgi:osmotically-inducible protein OsmY
MANADKGVVTLMGLVTTKEQKQRAHDLVAHTKGVTEVHAELQVSG